MRPTATSKALRAVQNKTDPASVGQQRRLLALLARCEWPRTGTTADLHDSLLYLAAHPHDADIARRVEAALRHLERFLKTQRSRPNVAAWKDRGMPWVEMVTRFSHDATRWMLQHPDAAVTLDSFDQPRATLNDVLKLTLPALERSETMAELPNDELMDALRVKPSDRLRFIVNELARLDAQPLVKDHLYDALDVFLRIQPRSSAFSKARNRLPMNAATFFQTEMVKRFDVKALLNQPLPPPRVLDETSLPSVMLALKNTMALTVRETDPCTNLDPGSLHVYDLERGLSCALFGMTPDRQLPLESYVGFTLFKNGLPTAYGGSWVFGPRAAFGMNIFEPFRGGESGFMMAQVLRCYRQRFGVDYFEVDAHQFGLDNADGIASGAYWFYHRHGFRSIDPELDALSAREQAKIASRPGYRSSERTLLAFTGSNVALNLGQHVPMNISDITSRVTAKVAKQHGGDRAAMESAAVKAILRPSIWREAPAPPIRHALLEWAPVAAALGVTDERELALMAECVRAKAYSLDAYQAAVSAWLNGRARRR